MLKKYSNCYGVALGGKEKAILHREWTVDTCSHWEQKEINYQLLIMLLAVFFQESDYSSEEQNTFGQNCLELEYMLELRMFV